MKKTSTNRQSVIDWIYIVLGTFLTGFGISTFMNPARLAPGGVSGLGTILFHIIQCYPVIRQTDIFFFFQRNIVHAQTVFGIFS